MTVKKFWHRCMESELISRTSHCRMRMPPGTRTQQFRWTEAFPTKHEMAQTVSKKLLEDLLPRYGFPVRIRSDNGPGFVSKDKFHSVWPCKPEGLSYGF
ncbi:unnamed protein product [Nyctereutes procyonoides]|uniref:(raccoon dog) hypothetical protein n=1 Tax=Nyctereutes procyonoides TaxID=34880 RepID=A0A811Y269_NYCPR|nr:unnamed protein product [Nyctereutes procyonoides]